MYTTIKKLLAAGLIKYLDGGEDKKLFLFLHEYAMKMILAEFFIALTEGRIMMMDKEKFEGFKQKVILPAK